MIKKLLKIKPTTKNADLPTILSSFNTAIDQLKNLQERNSAIAVDHSRAITAATARINERRARINALDRENAQAAKIAENIKSLITA